MQANWLFFDMGSTIMDENAAMEQRIRESIRGTDISYELFAAKMAEFRARGLREDWAAFDYFGIAERAPWNVEAEHPYAAAEAVLRTLKARGYRMGIIANQTPGSEARLETFGLRAFFEDYDYIFRSQMEQVCECSKYLALKYLDELVDEGQLRALGRKNSRFYAPMPGCFGR